jgi:hypothetical protein
VVTPWGIQVPHEPLDLSMRATPHCEQHDPERHCETKASNQDAVLG